MKFIFRIEEGILITLEKGLMGMHATSILAKNGFGHEGRIDTMSQCNLLDNEAIGHCIICHCQGIGVTEVDFVLAGCHLVVAIFHIESPMLLR